LKPREGRCAVVLMAGDAPIHVYATFPSREVAEEWVARKNEAQRPAWWPGAVPLRGIVVPIAGYEAPESER